MKRRVFTFLSFVSLLLCVATCGLWVRSYVVGDELKWDRSFNGVEQETYEIVAFVQRRGYVSATGHRSTSTGPDITLDDPTADGVTRFEHSTSIDRRRPIRDDARSLGNSLGFYYDTFRVTNASMPPNQATDERVRVAIPHWFAAVLTAFLPAVWLLRLRRRRRLARVGLCPECGRVPTPATDAV